MYHRISIFRGQEVMWSRSDVGKDPRPACSNDIGYLDICFLYFNCAKLALTAWTFWPLGDGETRSMCSFKDIWGTQWFFCVIFIYLLGLALHKHTCICTHACTRTLTHERFMMHISYLHAWQRPPPFLLMNWLEYFISILYLFLTS